MTKHLRENLGGLERSLTRMEKALSLKARGGNGKFRWFLHRESWILLRRAVATLWEALRLWLRQRVGR